MTPQTYYISAISCQRVLTAVLLLTAFRVEQLLIVPGLFSFGMGIVVRSYANKSTLQFARGQNIGLSLLVNFLDFFTVTFCILHLLTNFPIGAITGTLIVIGNIVLYPGTPEKNGSGVTQ